ncbi:MAG TPA: hypothetical protein VK427_26075 [Kofleriaceae bacterium]|nr:hypothetical protein [Kofleriaceae bacterium]
MQYRERLLDICQTGDWDAAFELVKSIFHDAASQKIKGTPTDFLDEDAEPKITAARGFDQMAEGFRPRESLDKRVRFVKECLAERRERDEPSHAFTPFNTIVFVVKDYEQGSVGIQSMHDRNGVWVRQFGLHHDIIYGDDSHEEYRFTYDLNDGSDEYRFFYGGEQVSNAVLHHDAKLVIFARWLVKLVDKLVDDPEFAAFPKALPFQFVIVGSEGYGQTARPPFRVALVPPITEATLENRHSREAWLAAAQARGDTGVDSRFVFLLPKLADLTSPEAVELVTLAREQAHLRAIVQQLAEASLVKDDDAEPGSGLLGRAQQAAARLDAWTFVQLLSALGDVDIAVAHRRKVFRQPLPTTWGKGRHRALDRVEHQISLVFGTWVTSSDEERAALEPDWNAAITALRAAGETEPFVTILLAEREAAPRIAADGTCVDDGNVDEDDDEPEDDDGASKSQKEPWPGSWLAAELRELPRYVRALCKSPPAGYVDALRAAIRAYEPADGYGRALDLIEQRLLALGPRAKDAATELLEWAPRWGANGGTKFVARIGKVLMTLGVEEVPAFVHAVARKEPYMVEDFYPRWAAAVPTRRVNAFVEAFRANPETFERADAWEELIYDSEPGLVLFVAAIVGTTKSPPRVDRSDALARLSKATPTAGPLLRKLVYQLADKVVAESSSEARLLLEGMPTLDPARSALLRRTRIADTIAAIDARAPDTASMTSRLAHQYPGDALVTFVSARQLVSASPEAAAELVRTALDSLSADDIVYRKAILECAGLSLDAWEDLDVVTCYALLRIAIEHFRSEHYDGDIVTSGFEADPFYAALAARFEKLTPDEISTELDGWRAHLGLDTKLRDIPDAELQEHIDTSNWQTTWVIVQRLAKGEERWRLERLLHVWGVFDDDESRRAALTDLIWPRESWRTALVTDDRVTPHLAWLVEHAPSTNDLEMLRTVCATLLAADKPALVVELAQQLDKRLVTRAFLSIFPAYQRLRDWDGAIALLERTRAETSPKQPEYVLLTSNIAVTQIHGDLLAAAEATLDALFAMDWTRFDYHPDPDRFTILLGSDLDAQFAEVFRKYMGMAKFNAACLYARTGRTAQAVSALHEAVALNPAGYPAKTILAEVDFVRIRDDASFTQLISSLEGAS